MGSSYEHILPQSHQAGSEYHYPRPDPFPVRPASQGGYANTEIDESSIESSFIIGWYVYRLTGLGINSRSGLIRSGQVQYVW